MIDQDSLAPPPVIDFFHARGRADLEMRDMVAYEGWAKFVSFEPKFRHNEGADRLEKG